MEVCVEVCGCVWMCVDCVDVRWIEMRGKRDWCLLVLVRDRWGAGDSARMRITCSCGVTEIKGEVGA